MKRIIMFLLLFAALKVAGQTTGYLRYDTVKIMKNNGACELYVINKTKDSLGLLTNIGGGLTQFKKPRVLTDSTFVIGNDTLKLIGRPGSNLTNATGSGDTLLTADNTIKRIRTQKQNILTISTNANSILFDPDSTIYMATNYRLGDTARVLRELIGSGGVSKLADSTGSKVQAIDDSTFVLNTGVGGIYDSTVYAYPGDTLQRKLELVPEHGRLVIMPGLHELPLCEQNSIMYVDRSNLTIEFSAGSHVKVADSSNSIIDSVEINRNYGAINGLDDISAQTTIHPPIVNQSIQIQIASVGTPDQFTVSGASSGNGVYNITGDFQAIGSTGIEVKFNATTGHTLNDLWWLITSSTPASVLRIGEGFHTDTIRNINIIGSGILDGNAQNQDTVNGRAHESNYTVGIFGRVHNVTIRDVSIINGERSIMASGRHSGTFNQNGNTTGGESFDVSNLRIFDVNSYDNTAGFLFGHPAYRGYTKNVFVKGCSIINTSSLATVEPNHRCDSFVLVDNYIENQTGGSSLHLWRAPSNGKIFNNIIRGTTGDNAPSGWYRSFGLNNWADYDNNLFSLSQQNAINSTNNASRIGLGTTSPTTKLQVVGPHVSGQGLVNIKGSSTVGFVVLNTTTAPGTTGFSLQSGGGAVGSVQGNGTDTTLNVFNDRYPIAPTIKLYNNGSVNFGVPSTKPTVRFQFRDTVTFSSVAAGAIRTIAKFEYKWNSNTPNPFAGHGLGIDFDAGNASAITKNVAKIELPYTDGTNGSEDVDYVIKLIRAGVMTEAFRALSTGNIAVQTVDSSSSPENLVWHDPITKQLKKTSLLAASKNISNTSLTANGSYTQDWNHFPLTFNNISSWNLDSKEDNGDIGRKLHHAFFTSPFFSIVGTQLHTSVRNASDLTDSVYMGLQFFNNSTTGDYNSALVASDAITGGAKVSQILVGTRAIRLQGSDSILLKGVPVGATDTVFGAVRNSDNEFKAVLKAIPQLASGTYTPTLTNVTNITGTTAYACQYTRVGNVVTVSGKINIDPTATGLTEVGLTLPIASSIANDYECAGTIATGANNAAGSISGDATNDRAHISINTGSNEAFDYFFTFTYQVL